MPSAAAQPPLPTAFSKATQRLLGKGGPESRGETHTLLMGGNPLASVGLQAWLCPGCTSGVGWVRSSRADACLAWCQGNSIPFLFR